MKKSNEKSFLSNKGINKRNKDPIKNFLNFLVCFFGFKKRLAKKPILCISFLLV